MPLNLTDPKLKVLKGAIDALAKEFGEGTIQFWDSERAKSQWNDRVFPTSSFSLNRAFGVGGVPFGRVLEVYGANSSGKTTLCWDLIASCQRQGHIAAMIDSEHAADLDWARKNGVKI